MNLIIILVILFAALFLIVALVERFGKKHSEEEVAKMSRWIFPLVALVAVLSTIRYFFMN